MKEKPTVLIIDDEQGIRDMLAFDLGQRCNYNVITAGRGSEGLEKAQITRPDVIITDIKMPDMSGVEVLGEMKKRYPDIEVIMATGYGTMETAIESLRKGAFDYIGKPFNIDEMHLIIEHALEKRRLRDTVALYDISKVIFSTINMPELMEKIISAVMQVLKADDASIMLLDTEKKLYIAASYSLSDGIKEETRLAMGERIAGLAAKDKQAFLLRNGLKDDSRFNGITGREGIKSSLVVPLHQDDVILGVLNVNRLELNDIFVPADLQKAVIFGSLAVMAVKNAIIHKKLEDTRDQLIQAEKLAVIGQLASGIAHEINNPLGGILGCSQLIMEDANMDESNPMYADLKEIEAAAIRCKNIINQLLIFSRHKSMDFSEIDVNKTIENTLIIIGKQFELKNINIIRNLKAGLPEIKGNTQQLEQVILNLITNARDAIAPQKGTIHISTHHDENRGIIGISIEDSGKGMTRKVLNKIFDPFFTTKAVGQGTGLGLSVSLGIVEDHGGKIMVKSTPGKGTKFDIILPVINKNV